MGPTEQLPGEDGVMVIPVLLSLVWSSQGGKEVWKLSHVVTSAQSSLCFRCLSQKLPKDKKDALSLIYRAVEAETRYVEVEMEQRGKWISLANDKRQQLFAVWEGIIGQIERKLCFCCNNKVEVPNRPFFIARTFDKSYCRQFKAGFQMFGECNYSITHHLQLGMTSFKFCFTCLKSHFPRLIEAFSYDSQGIDPPSQDQSQNSLLVTQDFVDALCREIGTEAATQKLKDLNIRIIGPSQN